MKLFTIVEKYTSFTYPESLMCKNLKSNSIADPSGKFTSFFKTKTTVFSLRKTN